METRAEAKEALNKMIEALPNGLINKKLTFVVSQDIYYLLNRKTFKGHKLVDGSQYDLPIKDYALLGNSKDIDFARKNYRVYKAIKNGTTSRN